jgi:hypothetical protein
MDTLIAPEEGSSKTLGCMGYLQKTFGIWQQKGDFLKRWMYAPEEITRIFLFSHN